MHADFDKENGNNAKQTNGRPLRVLLVDDEKTMHEMMGFAIENTDYSLVSAANVDEAMKVICS